MRLPSRVTHVGRQVTSHATSAPDACSVLWDHADNAPVYGTAASARFWLALEQNGPWGRNAAVQSHLPRELGRELEQRCAVAKGRLSLIRRPGAHADLRPAVRRCYVAWSGASGTAAGPAALLLGAEIVDPADLLRLDLDALAHGDVDKVIRSLPGLHPTAPVLLICTNGRRDVCCAVRGRPVAAAGQRSHPGRVWECSHTGGHRFSPTGVLLPWGRTLARLDDRVVGDVVLAADDGRLPANLLGPRHDRGWSALSPREQAAESAVRSHLGETELEALTTTDGGDAGVLVRDQDGRRWVVDLAVQQGEPLRNSCGAVPLVARTWATTLHER